MVIKEVDAYPFARFPSDERAATFPIGRPDLWKFYTDARECYWVPAEISFHKDKDHFNNKLTPGEQRFVKYILAFFATSDNIVNVNITERFKREVDIFEANYFYSFQEAMENIHSETYSLEIEC